MFSIFYLYHIYIFFYSVYVFFFFKQKTAYELRISDWSSDVCSSDLTGSKYPFDPKSYAASRKNGTGAVGVSTIGRSARASNSSPSRITLEWSLSIDRKSVG